MKNLLPGLMVMVAAALPMSVYAHPDSHHHYSVMAFVQHFFSQPDHLAIMVLLLAILLGSRSALRQRLSQLLSRHRSDKK